MDKTLKMSLLFDFYGPLLTQRQQGIFEMYFHDDLSLGEISEQLEISRQAVYDMLKRSTQTLEGFEAKLGLVERHQVRQDLVERVLQDVATLSRSLQEIHQEELADRTEQLKKQIKQLFSDA